MFTTATPQFSLILALTTLISACSTAPQPRAEFTEQLAIPTAWVGSSSVDMITTADTGLLALFSLPQLKQLIQETLRNNPDLRQTALRLKQQRLLTYQTRAASRPDLSLNLTSQRSKDQLISNNHSLALSLNWELDVWGRFAAASSAAESTTTALTLDYQAAHNSLAGRVIQRWIDISLRQEIIGTRQQWLISLQNNEAVILDRYRRGLGNLDDLATARAATARIKANISVLQASQRNARRALSLLRGEAAAAELPTLLQIPKISAPSSSANQQA